MADKLKQFSVVLSYDVQKTFIVEAKDEDEAYQIAYNGDEPATDEDWEYREHIETEEV
jgi:hypothetical protein